jgi:hypothetical protein
MAFGEFVRAHPIQTENALYAEFLVTPGSGFTEVRGILVDRAGHTVWTDRQTPQDDEFRRAAPRDPMACMALLLERLRQPLRLQDPTRRDAPEGKFARLYAERTGLPTEAERGAMRRRLEVARMRFAESHVAVFPILIGNQVDRTQAAHVAEVLTREKLGNVEVAAAEPVLQPPGGPNEQKRLWDLGGRFANTCGTRSRRQITPYTPNTVSTGPAREPSSSTLWYVIAAASGSWSRCLMIIIQSFRASLRDRRTTATGW